MPVNKLIGSDYYPFGMGMPGRETSVGNGYRYGFNGKEKDNEEAGQGNQYDYGFRIYNPRIGKFLSVDPLTKSYPWYTPYQFAGNKPINSIDLDGLEEWEVAVQNGSYNWNYNTALKPLDGGVYVNKGVVTKTITVELGGKFFPKTPVALSYEETMYEEYYPRKQASNSVNIGVIPDPALVAADVQSTESDGTKGKYSAYKIGSEFFKKLDAKSPAFATVEATDTKSMATGIATTCMKSNSTAANTIFDFHGTIYGGQYVGFGTDGFSDQAGYDAKAANFQLIGKFMGSDAKVLLGQCNANGCANPGFLQKMSTDINATIYAHKSYSLAAPLYLGKGQYFSKFLMKLTGYHSDDKGAVADQGKYLKIQGGTVTDVNKVRFSTSKGNAGEIKE